MNDIDKLGKGAIIDPPDPRDFQAMGHPTFGTIVVDWNKGFMNPEPPNENQNGSSSCVAQACSYYHWQLKKKDFCRRDIYAQIRIPGGGAYIRDGILRVVKYGQATRDETSDPVPETETAMSSLLGINPSFEASDREIDGYSVPPDIDAYAVAIQGYNGLVGGLDGRNADWADMANPKPPPSGSTNLWGHALHFFGYHLHNGVKCVIGKSSWGIAGNTTVHHIKKPYFDSKYIFSGWTLIKKNMTNAIFVHKTGTQEYGFYLPTIGVDALKDKALNLGLEITKSDNTVDFGLAKEINGL